MVCFFSTSVSLRLRGSPFLLVAGEASAKISADHFTNRRLGAGRRVIHNLAVPALCGPLRKIVDNIGNGIRGLSPQFDHCAWGNSGD